MTAPRSLQGLALVVSGLCALGCSGSGSSGGGSSGATAATTSGATASNTSATLMAPATVDPASTVTVVAGGFSPSGISSQQPYGVDEVSDVINGIVTMANLPRGDQAPSSPNQVTEVAYYGSVPPAYYTAADVAEVDAAGAGVPRYALIVAKHVREVLRRSGAQHVNLVGASFGGIITRYLIEKNLLDLASEGRIVRWLTLEGTAGGVWIASEVLGDPTLEAIATQFIPDPTDASTMTYAFARQAFGVDDPGRSNSPYFRDIVVGFQVSTDHDLNGEALRIATNKSNDGVLLVKDQAITLDARSEGPAIVLTDSSHDSARTHEGLAADVVNFIRSTRRVRVRLIEAEVLDAGESFLLGNAEVTFSASLRSPAAEQEWGVLTPIANLERGFGTAPRMDFSPPERLTLDADLFDWFVAPSETTLALTVVAEELDWSFYYDVFENPNVSSSDLATLALDLPVDTLGTQTHTLATADVSIVIEVTVSEERPGRD